MSEHTSQSPIVTATPTAIAETKFVQSDINQTVEQVKPLFNIQPKLSIGSPDDPYEKEADSVANQVMRMPENAFSVQRKCANCADEDKIQRKPFDISPFIQKTGVDGGGVANEAVSSQIIASQGGGTVMDTGTKSFMESRFNNDFSSVKIHTDSNAIQLSQALNAQAFTVGNDVYFNSGKYCPDTDSGKHLLAHELTHTIQQQGGIGRKIQKREVPVSMMGRLFGGGIAPQDWYNLDRQAWADASMSGTEASLSGGNTFMRSAYYNTVNQRPYEYTTIRERHDYYDLMSYVIQFDPNTPAAVRDVRFFHATTLVTGSPGVGSADTFAGLVLLGSGARGILRQVNADLFALNMRVIRDLIINNREPRDPTTGTGPAITPLDFDLRMVVAEQTLVENYITSNPLIFTPEVRRDINNSMSTTLSRVGGAIGGALTLNPLGVLFGAMSGINPSTISFDWAKAALGVTSLDFMDYRHRVAIGVATVHVFHRRTQAQYLAHMLAHPTVPLTRP